MTQRLASLALLVLVLTSGWSAGAADLVPAPSPSPSASAAARSTGSEIVLENLKFQHQLVVTVLEKLVFAIAVALIALWSSRLLERYKAREAYIAAFTQCQVEKVAEIWRRVYEWESFIEEGKPLNAFDEDQWQVFLDRMEPKLAKSQLMAEDLRKAVEADRFWLGQRLYSRFVAYHNLLRPYLAAMALRQENVLKEIKERLDRDKQDIMSVVQTSLRR